MKKYLFILFIFITPHVVWSQTVINPTRAEFTASPDHSVSENNQQLVTSYELRIFQVNQTTPIRITDLGKPTPDSSNRIIVQIGTMISQLSVGDYFGVVAAKGPGGENVSSPSNPFTVAIRPPVAPTNLIFTK